jgi:hypothetical protein
MITSHWPFPVILDSENKNILHVQEPESTIAKSAELLNPNFSQLLQKLLNELKQENISKVFHINTNTKDLDAYKPTFDLDDKNNAKDYLAQYGIVCPAPDSIEVIKDANMTRIVITKTFF